MKIEETAFAVSVGRKANGNVPPEHNLDGRKGEKR